GVAVGGRRPFVEGPRLTVGGLPPGLGEGVVGRPELEDLPIDGGQVDLGWYGAVPVGARGAHPGWSFSYGVCRGGTIPVLAGRSAVPPSLAGAMPGPTHASSAGGSSERRCRTPFFHQLRGDGPIVAVRTRSV